MRQLLLLLTLLFNRAFAGPKLYEIKKVENCPGDQPIISYLHANNGTLLPDQINFGGYLEIKDKVLGPIEILVETNRCDFTMKKCEKYSSLKVPAVCNILNSENSMFKEALKNFEPRILCPVKPAKYTTKDAVLDLSSFAVFPSDGFIWVVTIKGVSGQGKNTKVVLCLQVEAKISKARERRKKN